MDEKMQKMQTWDNCGWQSWTQTHPCWSFASLEKSTFLVGNHDLLILSTLALYCQLPIFVLTFRSRFLCSDLSAARPRLTGFATALISTAVVITSFANNSPFTATGGEFFSQYKQQSFHQGTETFLIETFSVYHQSTGFATNTGFYCNWLDTAVA